MGCCIRDSRERPATAAAARRCCRTAGRRATARRCRLRAGRAMPLHEAAAWLRTRASNIAAFNAACGRLSDGVFRSAWKAEEDGERGRWLVAAGWGPAAQHEQMSAAESQQQELQQVPTLALPRLQGDRRTARLRLAAP